MEMRKTKSCSSEFWKKLTRKLEQRYKSPDHGNLKDPLNELIYIILSAKTRISEHSKVYRKLRKAYPTWSLALKAGPAAIERVIRGGGLSNIRSKQIYRLLKRINVDGGRLTLKFLREWPDAEVEKYLTQLPGVGLKSARCVMLYSLGRKTFPVDTHTLRLFANLGLVKEKLRQDTAQVPLQELVPKRYRYKLHVNIVAHGREVCIPGRARCEACILNSLCLKVCT